MFMILNIFECEDFKNVVISFNLEFFSSFWFYLQKSIFRWKFLKTCQHAVIMSVFNWKVQFFRLMIQETQTKKKTLKFVKSVKGENNFKALKPAVVSFTLLYRSLCGRKKCKKNSPRCRTIAACCTAESLNRSSQRLKDGPIV